MPAWPFEPKATTLIETGPFLWSLNPRDRVAIGPWYPSIVLCHPKSHCLKHPPIKPTPKQPPNQHPKPPKHPATTDEQSPPPTAHNPWRAKSTIDDHDKWNKNLEMKNIQATIAVTVFLPLPPSSLASIVAAAFKHLNRERQRRSSSRRSSVVARSKSSLRRLMKISLSCVWVVGKWGK